MPRHRSVTGVLICVAVATVASLATAAAPALAVTRITVPVELTEPLLLEGFCPFPVTLSGVSAVGKMTLFFDDDGNLIRIFIRGRFVDEISADGNTITYNSAGTLEVVPQPDGSDLVTLNGRSFVADQGLVTGEPFAFLVSGRIVLVSTFNEETGFNDFHAITISGRRTDLCQALAA
ncbi:MAG TPA: hypothetical protein VNO17_11225 [Actinomycetota bacterium]|nr:hypothetical protein [Actinomycetota bacterium]